MSLDEHFAAILHVAAVECKTCHNPVVRVCTCGKCAKCCSVDAKPGAHYNPFGGYFAT